MDLRGAVGPEGWAGLAVLLVAAAWLSRAAVRRWTGSALEDGDAPSPGRWLLAVAALGAGLVALARLARHVGDASLGLVAVALPAAGLVALGWVAVGAASARALRGRPRAWLALAALQLAVVLTLWWLRGGG